MDETREEIESEGEAEDYIKNGYNDEETGEDVGLLSGL
jgi:hypothetical protein